MPKDTNGANFEVGTKAGTQTGQAGTYSDHRRQPYIIPALLYKFLGISLSDSQN